MADIGRGIDLIIGLGVALMIVNIIYTLYQLGSGRASEAASSLLKRSRDNSGWGEIKDLEKKTGSQVEIDMDETQYERTMLRIVQEIQTQLDELVRIGNAPAIKSVGRFDVLRSGRQGNVIRQISDNFNKLGRKLNTLAQFERMEARRLVRGKFGNQREYQRLFELVRRENNMFHALSRLVSEAVNALRAQGGFFQVNVNKAVSNMEQVKAVLIELIRINQAESDQLKKAAV